MNIFNLIHEQDTDAAWGCSVRPFASMAAAQTAMRQDWQATIKSWEYNSKEHHDEDKCECSEDTAIIRDGDDVEQWRIEAQEIDASMAEHTVCKTCGRTIMDREDGERIFTVNSGLPEHYAECESCHDESIDHNRIIQCEACGEWFSNDVLRGEVVGGDTFCPCPHCGRDIVDGQTREEREERDYIPQYSVVVTFATGGSHGFLIAANDKRQMLGKLLDRLGENNVANLEAIHIGFLYTGGDIIP